MKNLKLTFIIVVLAIFTASAQNEFANLKAGYNFPSNGGNNTMAEHYDNTGQLPPGYYVMTTQEIINKWFPGSEKLWVKFDQAHPDNTVISGGHYAHPNEEFVITPNNVMLFATKCGNYVSEKGVKPVRRRSNQTTNVYVTNNTMNTRPLHNEHSVIVERIERVEENTNNILQSVANSHDNLRNGQQTTQEMILEQNRVLAQINRRARNGVILGIVNAGLGSANLLANTGVFGNGNRRTQSIYNSTTTITDSYNDTTTTTNQPPVVDPPVVGPEHSPNN